MVMLLLLLGLSTASCASPAAVLQISGRGMACAVWHGGSAGTGQNCIYHHAVGSTSAAGGPWWGVVDPSTGICSAVPGVTDYFDNVLEVHDNLVPTAHRRNQVGYALGYARPNATSGAFAVAVTLPSGEQPGSVKQLDKVSDADWPPAWSESDGGGVIGWTYVEFHDTAAAAVGVNELLQILDTEDGSVVMTLGNVSTEYPDGIMGAPYYGFGHAIDTFSSILYTQSQNRSVRVLDLFRNKSLPALEGTSGTELLCMHYDSVTKTLGGIVNKTTSMELVSVDTTTGAISPSKVVWDTKTFPGSLEFFHHDDKPERFPPECT